MRRPHGEEGVALVEGIVLIVVLLVPVIWLVGAISQVHRAALATTAAAKEAAVSAARSGSAVTGVRAAHASAARSFSDQGLSASPMRMELSGVSGFARGTEISVRVAYPVKVLSLPFSGDARVWVRAVHTTEIDLYRSRD